MYNIFAQQSNYTKSFCLILSYSKVIFFFILYRITLSEILNNEAELTKIRVKFVYLFLKRKIMFCAICFSLTFKKQNNEDKL